MRTLLLGLGLAQAQDLSCIQCEYSFDHLGHQIGMGDPRCWGDESGDSPSSFSKKCDQYLPSGAKYYCAQELVSDWLLNGIMQFKLIKKCAVYRPENLPENKCQAGNAGFQFKDCTEFCDSKDCNKNRNSVLDLSAEKDDLGNVKEIECLECDTRTGADGTLDQCRTVPEASRSCPIYANAGCFSANKHPTGNSLPCVGDNCDPEAQEQYSKGCSPFNLPSPVCQDTVYNGNQYESCKKTCNSNKCNIGAVGQTNECYTCSVTVDQDGNPMGWGDVECVDGALSRHIETCAGDQDVCVTEMEIDWRPSGMQTVTVHRGCGRSADLDQSPESTSCSGTSFSAFRSKTCTKSCMPVRGEACNQDLEGISELFAGNNVQECRSCMDVGDIQLGSDGLLHDCAEDDSTIRQCPEYQTSGCFSSRSQNSLESQSISVHGCSAFEQDFPICTEFDTTGTIDPEGNVHGEDGDNVQHLRVCKETCRVDGCNDYVLDVPEPNNNLCYQCFAIYDNIGNMLTGDPGCYDPADTDKIDERYLKTCPGEEQHCVIEMEVDWLLGDTQKVRISRACTDKVPANLHPIIECKEGDLGAAVGMYKDCKSTWEAKEDQGVNRDTNLIEKSLGKDQVNSCHSCQGSSLIPDQRDNCLEIPSDANQVECPPYANTACYKTVSEHVEKGQIAVEVYRGCSTFALKDAGQEENKAACTGFRVDDTQYEMCKQTCYSDNCNNEEPDYFAEPLKCFQCQETWNHLNQSIGFSDTGCFMQPDEKYLHECYPDENMCVTQMEVDWTVTGEQNTIVRRRCGKANDQETTCTTGSTLNFQVKQCTQTSRGFGSNDNLNIASEFSHPNNQDNCYTCSHSSLLGEDTFNCFADDHPHTEDELVWRNCAIWQNAACFTSDNIHSEEEFGLITEVHRGCSSFELPNTSCAHMDYDDGKDYAVCRQTCTGSHCNSEKYPTDENNCECPPEL